MNMNLFSHGDRYLMVDCGITFEQSLADSQGRPAIQMPDPSFIAGQRESLDGLIITHAHEDHFGAVPYLWQELKCPVYATPFAAAVLRKKAAWRRAPPPEPLIEVLPGETHTIGSFRVTWLPITHSTPETCALLLETDDCRILHTADWKIDTRPVICLLYTSDAADEEDSVDLGGRRIIKKKKKKEKEKAKQAKEISNIEADSK